MVVCQWRTCGIFRYLVWPHTPAREDEGREKKKNLGDKKGKKLEVFISVLLKNRSPDGPPGPNFQLTALRACLSPFFVPWALRLCVSEFVLVC